MYIHVVLLFYWVLTLLCSTKLDVDRITLFVIFHILSMSCVAVDSVKSCE